jgi:LmbE family N-acetylglucosaminyl deacetylase
MRALPAASRSGRDVVDGLTGRVVVVSTHLDDAVFSLGATIAHVARRGADVEILTVFAGDPASTVPAAVWDVSSGFASEGEAAAARRAEDRAACAIVGARPVWLTFHDGQYRKPRDAAAVRGAVRQLVEGANAVLVPGYPLPPGDHAWLAETLRATDLPAARSACYLEQPYGLGLLAAGRDRPPVSSLRWDPVPTSARDRIAKWRALRAYRSQLAPLGLAGTGAGRAALARLLWSEKRSGGEAIAWLS